MVERCVILHAMPYSMKDEETGDVVEGVSVTYLPTTDLSPVEEKDDMGGRGVKCAKQTFSTKLFEKFSVLPAIYDVEFKLDVVKGKPVLAPIGLTCISSLAITEKKLDDYIKGSK